MRNQLLLTLLIATVFLSGCITQEGKITVSSVGLSRTLSSDIKQAKPSVPVTFILSIKNLASENAADISAQLLNLTDWRIENDLQELDNLLSGDLYKFSWVAYAPSTPNKTFLPFANLFYRMDTNAGLTLRVYNNDYLDTLKSEERRTIMEKSALLSSTISKLTPITTTISLKQPFILTEYSQEFPFVIEVKNVGPGETYNDDATYVPGEGEKDYFRFNYQTNSSLSCDYDDSDLVRPINGSKSIVCRLSATQDEVEKYSDFSVDFTMSYTYLDKASMKIEVK
jgi:hypothetical protein